MGTPMSEPSYETTQAHQILAELQEQWSPTVNTDDVFQLLSALTKVTTALGWRGEPIAQRRALVVQADHATSFQIRVNEDGKPITAEVLHYLNGARYGEATVELTFDPVTRKFLGPKNEAGEPTSAVAALASAIARASKGDKK
jgi:hypothetical protein